MEESGSFEDEVRVLPQLFCSSCADGRALRLRFAAAGAVARAGSSAAILVARLGCFSSSSARGPAEKRARG